MSRWLSVVLLVAACSDEVDKTAMCQLTTTRSAVTVENRRVIGQGAAYVADLALAARDDELAHSIAARRQVAWQAVSRVLAPVPLGDPRLATSFGGVQPTIPAWHTWYAQDDFTRTFKHLYRDLGPVGRKARAPIDGAAGLAWNAVALDELVDWPEQRYLDYLATVDTAGEVDGLGGATRVGYSPGTLEHLLESYAQEYACRLAPDPDPVAPDATRPGKQVTEHDTVAIDQCELRVLGPFIAAPGAQVTVTTHGDGDADVYVRRGAAPDALTYDCKSAGGDSDETCVVDGGDEIYVGLFGAKPSAVELDITYLTSDVADPACLDGAMPRDAVLVKADWRRVIDGELLPTFDTSAARMTNRLAGTALWNQDGGADPKSDAIYTVTLASGAQYRLPALHVMTKELDHWLWITLWWSPQPDVDFGADRPPALASPGPWRNYKMCVVSDYVEQDPDARGGQAGSLGDALAAVHGGVGAPSWCSNPYVELGEGNAATNCIGCHQHGGTNTTAESILTTQPHHGTTRVRNNFFTDYVWAIKGGGGDDLSSYIQAEVDYWDAND
ncbi:MAG: PPC domain-containing protein [Proteobacteria bacterium]|nr:PPC domain-containing protein [Pseudomonadota bacterium]